MLRYNGNIIEISKDLKKYFLCTSFFADIDLGYIVLQVRK